mgnify:FL=1
MDNRSWKKERDLLSEAYGKTKTVTEEEGLPVSGATEEPMGGDELTGDPVDAIIDAQREPDEVDAEIESLKNLLLNPPAAKIEEYADAGQLHVYVDMLKKKLEAAEAVQAAVRGTEDGE